MLLSTCATAHAFPKPVISQCFLFVARFEVFTALKIQVVVFWGMLPPFSG
jgi:hypothetical protein